MDWQLSYLERQRTTTADSGTLYIDLPRAEQISMIFVEFWCNNTSPTSRDYSRTCLDHVTSIRVLLEGNKDAYNLQPEVASYLAFCQSNRIPNHRIRERGYTGIRLPIYFGRYPKDEEYLLDTAAYSSAQLQIAYALNTTYETSGSVGYTVWFLRPVTRLSPLGFVRSRIVQEYTSSGSAETKQLDLPVGLPWLRAGFRVFDIDAFNQNCVTDVDLDVDQGRLHLFDGRMDDLARLNELWYGTEIVGPEVWAMPVSGNYLQHFMADPVRLTWADYGAALAIYNSSAIWSNRHLLTMRSDDGSAITAALDTLCTAIGGAPFSCYSLYEGNGDVFNAPAHGEAFVEFTLGAYAALYQLFVQEVVRGAL